MAAPGPDEALAGEEGGAGEAPGENLEIHLDRDIAAWILAHPHLLPENPLLHAPTHLHMETSLALDPDWRAFFSALRDLGVKARAQNLPACLAPGATLAPPLRILDAALFHDDGRLQIDGFVSAYITNEYRAKSLRCRKCPLDSRCEGAPLQYLRHAGFRVLQPVDAERAAALLSASSSGEEALSPPAPRLADGAPPVPPAPPLPVPGNPPVPFIDLHAGRRS